jgi:hypothetical protein
MCGFFIALIYLMFSFPVKQNTEHAASNLRYSRHQYLLGCVAAGYGNRAAQVCCVALGWACTGRERTTAMVEIFRVKQERDRFLNDVSVVGFINEQGMLDDYLFNGIKQQRPDLLKLPYLQTQSGNPSKSKCVAFLYQHEETAVMEVVRAAVVAHGKTVLASIHDAIVTKEKLGVELLSEIEQLMRAQTGNRYWRLGAKQLKRYASAKPNP